jgi:nucleoside-diphosphate-sugar epimerase
MTPDPGTFATNVTSTYNVFWAAEVLGIRRVVWASSETLLGLPMSAAKLRQVPLDESSELFPETAYSLSKLCGEVMAAQFARRTGITFVGLRFSNVIQADEYKMFESWQDDPKKREWNLWGYVDARDTALACRLGIEAKVKGSENFIIAAADTVMRKPSAELMAASFPKCKVRPLQDPRQTLLSIEKARKALGYEPRHSWIGEIGRR